MALITCPECGKEISDKAAACPNCGAPVEKDEISFDAGYESSYGQTGGETASQTKNTIKSKYTGKISRLSIVALVLCVMGVTAIIGAILAIVDLTKKDERKKILAIIALCICPVWYFVAAIAFDLPTSEDELVDRVIETVMDSDSNESKYYGTWEFTGICSLDRKNVMKKNDAITKFRQDGNQSGVNTLESMVIVFRHDGEAYLSYLGETFEENTGKWHVTDEGIGFEDLILYPHKGYLLLKMDDCYLVLGKTSDNQEFRSKELSAEDYDYEKNISASEPNSDNYERSSSNNNTIRPEFKEAMDSYEAFFDEYISFMKRYSSSNDIMSMMNDYSNYMSKYMDTMDKMSKMGSEAMNDAELQYYIEVTARIEQKLMAVSMTP